MSDETALLFDFQGFSFHDGPGSRTVVFFKGCPLRCRWCANPEGQVPHLELMLYRERCEKNIMMCCASVKPDENNHQSMVTSPCVMACKDRALMSPGEGMPVAIQRDSCLSCTGFACVSACNYHALQVKGFSITVDDLMKKIQRDRPYWGSSGGVTVSGGEPMDQYPFLLKFLSRCFDSYIHTAMETSGYAPWEYYRSLLGYLDWIFFDIKCMNDDLHRAGTGISNRLILKNAKQIASSWEGRLVFRIPVIPGYNDSWENIASTAKFIADLGNHEVHLVPLHHLGESKYDLLGRVYRCRESVPPDIPHLRKIQDLFAEYSIACYFGNDTPF